MRMLGTIGVACIAVSVLTSGVAGAQDASTTASVEAAAIAAVQQRLRASVPIVALDREGRRYDGFVQRVSPTSISIAANGQTYELPFRDIGRIEKHGDSLLNGAAIGVVASSPYWAVVTAFACDGRGAGCGVATGLGTAGIFAALGAYIDSRRRGRTVIYGPPRGKFVEHFSDLWMSVESGDRIEVTGVNGTVTAGIFQRAANGSLTALVDGQIRTFGEADVLRVTRRGDSLRNGTLIGAIIGALTSFAPCDGQSDCLTPGERAFAAGFSALTLGAIGALVDSLRVGHTDVYRARDERVSMRLAPDLAGSRRAVVVLFSF